MSAPTIISADLLRPSVRRVCVECGKVLGPTMLRVAVKDGTAVYSSFYCPHIDQDDEIRGCAPDSPIVRAALARRSRSTPSLTTDAAHGRGEDR